MSTNNADNIAIPLVVAKGGTGNASFATVNAPLCGGATSTGPLQQASTGFATANTLLTSSGSGLPTWKFGRQGLVLISTKSASNVTTVVFNNTQITAAYTNYLLVYRNIQNLGLLSGSGILGLQMLFSSNNGGSYASTNYASGFITWATNSSTLSNENSTVNASISKNIGAANRQIDGQIWLYIPTGGNCSYVGQTMSALGGSVGPTWQYGYQTTLTGINNIQISFPGTTFATQAGATFSLYGLQQ